MDQNATLYLYDSVSLFNGKIQKYINVEALNDFISLFVFSLFISLITSFIVTIIRYCCFKIFQSQRQTVYLVGVGSGRLVFNKYNQDIVPNYVPDDAQLFSDGEHDDENGENEENEENDNNECNNVEDKDDSNDNQFGNYDYIEKDEDFLALDQQQEQHKSNANGSEVKTAHITCECSDNFGKTSATIKGKTVNNTIEYEDMYDHDC
jgi:hypothetical protein